MRGAGKKEEVEEAEEGARSKRPVKLVDRDPKGFSGVRTDRHRTNQHPRPTNRGGGTSSR